MRVLAPAPLLLLLAGCGGAVVFEEPDAGDGGAPPIPTTSQASTGRGAAGGAGPASTSIGTTGTGGEPPDGSCVAADYCACIDGPTCQVIAEDCFCPCEEPCSEPCDCGCGGGAFLQCVPGSIHDPGALDVGVWLVGWSGGLNHFSWLRFDPDGDLQVLDAVDMVGNEPLFPCRGSGWWSLGDGETVGLELPQGCVPTSLTFVDWRPTGLSIPGALQEASVLDGGAGATLGAWRFPDEACSADFTSCVDPFAP